jgi:5'-nucleotidase
MAKKKNILVVNDDGIDALGIHKLAEALSRIGNVYVCSPHTQQSACGHAITIGRPVYIEDVPFPEAIEAVSVEGTPADCVKLGLGVYRDRGVEIDMVFSGINHGMNLGTDTLYSGTVSAAIEGAFCGLPSVAVSISSKLAFHMDPVNFEAAMEMAEKLALSELVSSHTREGQKSLDINFIHESHVILNVNVPDLPLGEIKGVKICPLSYRAYNEEYLIRDDDDGRPCYYYSGRPWTTGEAEPDESDIIANGLDYITITPLHFDLTDRRMMEKLRDTWSE